MISRRAHRAAIGLALAGPIAALAFPDPASAHALVGREDLPIPAWLFAWGASLVLIVSFVALSFGWREPRLESDSWRPLSERASGLIVNPVTRTLAGLVGAGLLSFSVYSGFRGTEDPAHNFTITFIFVTAWLGIVLLSVLFGDVFRAFNPWRAIAAAASAAFRTVVGQPAPAPLAYPERLGRWPAVIGILGFVWLELIYGASGLNVGLEPETTAIAILVYSAITFVAMALFGIEAWIDRGEAFSNYFRMFSLLSPLEVRDGRLGRRTPLSAAGRGWALVPGSVALVIVSIGTTGFDGAQEGLLSDAIKSAFDALKDWGLGGVAAYRLSTSLYLLISLLVVAAIFTIGVRGMRTVAGSPPFRDLARAFAHTLIPIALAYLVAHYFSLFVFQEQAQFSYLLTDPLGFDSSGLNPDYGVITATEVWYVQVAALVVGHVTALTLAHDRAIASYRDQTLAVRSQYWMLAVMVAFTCLGLFLLSQANA